MAIQSLCLSLNFACSQGCFVQDCLSGFFDCTKTDEPYLCECCKNQMTADKRTRIARCPPVLVLQLKRFCTQILHDDDGAVIDMWKVLTKAPLQ